eukprot:NODE_635_length_5172_cov_1.001183.p1 type:complete len:908 gc:universal NODE_635_length_5172_cov_1.001183:4551-1828(-)
MTRLNDNFPFKLKMEDFMMDTMQQPPEIPEETIIEPENFDENLFPNQFIENIEEEEIEFETILKDTLRYVAGFKKGRKKQSFSPEAQKLMGDANLHFANQDFDLAITKIKECIQASPIAYQPWNLLGLIYQELGNELKSMQTYFIAAHFDLKNTPLWLSLARFNENRNQIKEAIYCYTKAISNNATPELLLIRSSLFLKVNMPLKCAKDYLEIVKIKKHSMSLMMDAVNVFLSRGRFDLVSQILLQVFEGFKQILTQNVEIQNFPGNRPFLPLNYIHVDLLFESLLCQKLYQEALVCTKSAILVLYLYKTGQEVTEELQSLLELEDVDESDDLFDQYAEEISPALCNPEINARGVPLTWRTYLGICRCFTDSHEVAMRHFVHLFDDFKPACYLLYDQVFSILLECQMYENCADCVLKIIDHVNDEFIYTCYFNIAQAYAKLDKVEESLEFYQKIIQNEGPFANESRIHVAQLLTTLNLNATDAWRDVRTQIPPNLKIHLNRAYLENNKVDLSELQDYLLIIKNKCSILHKELKGHIEAGQAEFQDPLSYDVKLKSLAIECTEAYSSWFDIFLKTTAFFSKEKTKKFMGLVNDKLHYENTRYDFVETIVTNEFVNDDDLNCIFLNATFKEWYEMILNLVECYMLSDNYQDAIDVLKKAIPSNLFMNINRKCHLYLIMLSCYKKLQLYEEAFDCARQLIYICPYRFNSYQLFMHLIPHDYHGLQIMCNNNFSRCFKRHFKKMSTCSDKECQYASILLCAYTLMNSRSIQPALQYLQRSILIKDCKQSHLLLGMAWITRGMNRSTEDRHINIITGIHYILKYFREEKRQFYQQACYNTGRAFHHIGLNDHAFTFYLKCLCKEEVGSMQLALKRRNIKEIDQVCAYNLALILKKSKSVTLANQLLMHFNQF